MPSLPSFSDHLDAPLWQSSADAWRILQNKFFEQDLMLIPFSSDQPENAFWHWYIDLSSEANKELQNLFGNEEQKEAFFWIQLDKQIKGKGFFLPVEDLKNVALPLLEKYSGYCQIRQQYFPWVFFLRKLKEETEEATPLPVRALWYYFTSSILFYKEVIKLENKNQPLVAMGFPPEETLVDFEQKLPSDQLLILLHNALVRHFYPEDSLSYLEALVQKANPEVQNFWYKYTPALNHYFQHGFEKNMYGDQEEKRNFTDKDLVLFSESEIRNNFYSIFIQDFTKVKIQEVLAPEFEQEFLSEVPQNLLKEYNLQGKLSLSEQLKQAVSKVSIMDRIKSVKANIPTAPKASFLPPIKEWLPDNNPQWQQIPEDQSIFFINAIDGALPTEKKENLQENAAIRWYRFLLHRLHQFTSPFLLWKTEGQHCFPQWNMLSEKQSQQLVLQFEERKNKEAEEKKQLNILLSRLLSLRSLGEIISLHEQVIPFTFSAIQQEWANAVKNHTQAVRGQYHYRSQRMIEFGIIEHPAEANAEMEVWLDEMLAIEREVSPYIGFVKKVFQSALPNRKTIEFDPYRHSSDGIEFDEDTIQDQNKWMSGEVMKTLRYKIDYGEIAQINAFCLDASGSMRHYRMRNLFKILYLLVLGLEGRKSYDCFHFFGTSFFPGAEFSSDYTNRSVLFQVLQKIAEVDVNKVRFFGTGGTNLWEGISECHSRTLAFGKKLQSENPDINHVKSIFVITDGEPSAGLVVKKKLQESIQQKREDGEVAIKGIYIKPDEYSYSFMEDIFGENNFVETHDFGEAISKLVYIMGLTYKKQRVAFRERERREKVDGKIKGK